VTRDATAHKAKIRYEDALIISALGESVMPANVRVGRPFSNASLGVLLLGLIILICVGALSRVHDNGGAIALVCVMAGSSTDNAQLFAAEQPT